MEILTVKFKGNFSLSTPRGRKGGVDFQPHFFCNLNSRRECVVNFNYYKEVNRVLKPYIFRQIAVNVMDLYTISVILVMNQLDAKKILFYNKFIMCLYMFRALLYSTSGGQNCIIQHLISSHL